MRVCSRCRPILVSAAAALVAGAAPVVRAQNANPAPAPVGATTTGTVRVARRVAGSYPLPASSVTRTESRLVLDGALDEPFWASADSITDFRTKEPTEGGTPSERTVVRVVATPDGLAVGWWCYDREPRLIRRTQMRRDAELRSDDYVSLGIDGLYDQRSAFYFRTNSNGALWDGEHVNSEQGNEEWDGVWDARARVTADGWVAEMLIPWATLRYRRDGEPWGMNFRRFIRRRNEEILWSGWKRTEGIRFLEAEGEVDGFRDLPPRARLEMRPYALGEARFTERAFGAGGVERVTANALQVGNAGLDLKLPVTGTLTLDATVNPDFAQAEVDRQIVNLTRFPLFFPEQRPFFTEGASIFEYGARQQTQLFYSRRIGLGAGGTPIDIPGGLRLQGRAGRQQVGLIAARTGDGEWATDVVGRVRRDVLGRGYVGAMATLSDKSGRPGSLAGGVDVNLPYRVFGDQNFVVLANAAWSRDSVGASTGGHYRVVLDYPNDRMDLVARYDRVDRAFRPALGFVQQRGIHRLGGNLAITPRPKGGPIRRFEFNALGYNVVWRDDGPLDNASFTVRPFGAQFQTGDRVEVNLSRRFDRPDTDFGIFPGVRVPSGTYVWNRAELRYVGTAARWWSVDGNASTGTFYDGRSTDASLGVRFRLEPHVLLTVDGSTTQADLAAGSFTARTVRLRGDYAANPRLNATLFAQYDNQSERLSVNARVRWTRRPGSDLYVVYTSGWATDLEDGMRWRAPVRGGLVMKYVQFLRY
jgi:hypothetical protein